jgi:hypothetical protein
MHEQNPKLVECIIAEEQEKFKSSKPKPEAKKKVAKKAPSKK